MLSKFSFSKKSFEEDAFNILFVHKNIVDENDFHLLFLVNINSVDNDAFHLLFVYLKYAHEDACPLHSEAAAHLLVSPAQAAKPSPPSEDHAGQAGNYCALKCIPLVQHNQQHGHHTCLKPSHRICRPHPPQIVVSQASKVQWSWIQEVATGDQDLVRAPHTASRLSGANPETRGGLVTVEVRRFCRLWCSFSSMRPLSCFWLIILTASSVNSESSSFSRTLLKWIRAPSILRLMSMSGAIWATRGSTHASEDMKAALECLVAFLIPQSQPTNMCRKLSLEPYLLIQTGAKYLVEGDPHHLVKLVPAQKSRRIWWATAHEIVDLG